LEVIVSNRIRIINVEAGMPTVAQAELRLVSELRKAKAERVTVVKIIHGYGSSGVGGKIKDAARKVLAVRQREGKLQAFVAGEEWSIFTQPGRNVLDRCPELSRDSDLERGNAGITIAVI
jgi:hypothetical protein